MIAALLSLILPLLFSFSIHAGPDQTVKCEHRPCMAKIAGGLVWDKDQPRPSFVWSVTQIKGPESQPPAQLIGTDTLAPVLIANSEDGAYLVQLIASDGKLIMSAKATITFTH